MAAESWDGDKHGGRERMLIMRLKTAAGKDGDLQGGME